MMLFLLLLVAALPAKAEEITLLTPKNKEKVNITNKKISNWWI